MLPQVRSEEGSALSCPRILWGSFTSTPLSLGTRLAAGAGLALPLSSTFVEHIWGAPIQHVVARAWRCEAAGVRLSVLCEPLSNFPRPGTRTPAPAAARSGKGCGRKPGGNPQRLIAQEYQAAHSSRGDVARETGVTRGGSGTAPPKGPKRPARGLVLVLLLSGAGAAEDWSRHMDIGWGG